MTKTEFKKVARDSEGNARRKAKGEKLVYDYDVIVDGERRACFRAERPFGVGYRLIDAIGRAVVEEGRTYSTHLGVFVKARSNFATFIGDLLATGKLPTVHAMAEAQRKAKLDAAREANAEAARKEAWADMVRIMGNEIRKARRNKTKKIEAALRLAYEHATGKAFAE